MVPPGQVVAVLTLALAPCGEAGTVNHQARTPPTQGVRAPQDPFADLTVQEAQGLARMLDKHVLVAFYAEDCPACDTLDATTFSDPGVRAWLEELVMAVRLRPGDDYLTARWRVSEHPTLLFLTWQDEELGRLTGPLPAQAFLEASEAILDGTGGLERARERLAGDAEDPWAHLLLARALVAHEQFDEYGDELLWVLDATRGDPTWRRLREREVLRELGLLIYRGIGTVREALVERRNACLTLLLAEDVPAEQAPSEDELALAARDVRLLNVQLGATQRTLDVWERVRAREDRSPAVARELFGWEVAGLLMRERRYEELLEALPDPLVVLQERMAELSALEAAARESSVGPADPLVERNRLLTDAGSLFEALLGAGREQDAEDLSALLVAFAPQARAWSSLVLGAKRAGRLELAQALLERGLAELAEPAERERLRRFGETALGR
jgi:hypothetical protein